MKLYHGTNEVFTTIDLSKSKPNKDFGRGFYLSPDYEQALSMAKIKLEQQKKGTPIVMEFEIDETEMNGMRILHFADYSEPWAKFVIANRSNATSKPIHDYDIVVGPIANDRVGVQL